eukprot:CAMPEP_0185192728 /NCGR_PEP_ID=MMETSP1140-20130426/20108_1 /TAXON_ID=298111 /ORGANISM="Pavlova sp., Strain CCMP459" /LENGTH=60 /DNA_ID=CAMNT_0027759489 /DNA_START=57 /DNA_END=239 /DNA_ORIENTATION=+
MPLQSSVPFIVMTTIMTVVGGIVPLVHYLGKGEPRKSMVDNWDRMLFTRDKKIDKITGGS